MLSKTVFATAILAGASVASAGSAIVVNACQYPVKLCNVPAADGGYTEIDKSIDPNGTYTQEWTELTNGDGWSIKLSPDDTLDHVLQYEYTFHNDGIIWYDLSEVDGNPWDGDWEITSDNSQCTPKQQAYRYATDDAYGMQSCPDDTSITVTLCSGEAQNDGAAASASSSVAAASASSSVAAVSTSSSVAAASSTEAYQTPSSTAESSPAALTTSVQAYSTEEASSTPSSTPSSISTSEAETTSTFTRHHWWTQGKAYRQSTTLVTVAATSTNNADSVVTNVVTKVETVYATATAYAKREQPHHQHHGHPHFRA